MAYVKDMQNFVSREDIFLIKQPMVAKKNRYHQHAFSRR